VQETRVGPTEFTRRLLQEGRRARVALPLERRPAAPPPRTTWLAEALVKDALGWLCRRGGWRRRLVVVGGRRREGRFWAEGVAERLDLRFTALTLRLLVAAMEAPAGGLPPVPAELLEAARAAFSGDDPPTGDLLAVHRLVDRLLAATPAASGVPAGGGDEDGEEAGGVERLAEALGRLGETIKNHRALTLVTRDGHVLASTHSERGQDGFRERVLGWLGAAAGARELEASGWRDLGKQRGGRVLALLLEGLPFWLLLQLQPRARSVNVNQERVARAVERLREGALSQGSTRALVAERRRRELLRLSPLSLAFRPEEHGALDGEDTPADACQERLAALFRGDRAVLLSYLDDALARSWLAEEEARRRLPAREAQAAYAAAARGLHAFCAAGRARPDALRPVIRLLDLYLIRFGTRVPVVAAFREQARGFDRASEREAFLATVARLFALGRDVTRAAEDALATAFVDRTEEQKVLLTAYHELFKEVGPEIEAIRRELAGEIG